MIKLKPYHNAQGEALEIAVRIHLENRGYPSYLLGGAVRAIELARKGRGLSTYIAPLKDMAEEKVVGRIVSGPDCFTIRTYLEELDLWDFIPDPKTSPAQEAKKIALTNKE
jgi:hypothetical protein